MNAMEMRKLERHELCLLASMLALAPLTFGYPLGLFIGVWAIVAMVALRTPYEASMNAQGIANERSAYVTSSGVAHPVTLDDYASLPSDGAIPAIWVEAGQIAHSKTKAAGYTLVTLFNGELQISAYEVSPDPPHPMPHKVTVLAGSVGLVGYAAGIDVYVGDVLGLADAFAARAESTTRGPRPGHERQGQMWVTVRASPGTFSRSSLTDATLVAYSCQPLVDLEVAITTPLTLSRFLQNLVVAPHYTSLRFSVDPSVAVQQLC